MTPAYRYVSDLEVRVIMAGTPQRVPTVDRFGLPKIIHMTWDHYVSAGVAESALRIGARNPNGPTVSPRAG